ncbi:hypothetical protein ASG99_07690 [Bacillus sp. Soil768D1]|nr:hypothetical protein ASG99_07690 [Bacillus sp. Soil768D1]
MECNNNLVTIIVPVYNSENHLVTCIDSILQQSYKNIEVILVNDGSIDNSGLICNEYSRKDYRVKVIHQKNLGPSVARNKGINAASGDYIQFVDSDDYIETNMTNKLIEGMIKSVQLVICGYKSRYINHDNVITNDHALPVEGVLKNKEFMLFFGELYKNSFIHSPCNKLYVTNIIKKMDIRFKKNLYMGEDLLFNLEYIDGCNSISIINEQLYNYMKDDDNNSLTSSFKKDLFENQQMLFHTVREFLINKKCYEKNKYFIEITYTDRIVNCFENLFHINSSLKVSQIREQIYNIVYDDCVRNNIIYFKSYSIQKRLMGEMIKYKSINSIYFYFTMKNLLRSKMKPIFNWLKLVINKKQTTNNTTN